ncbi:MAG: hypothetical protein U1D69_09770 [Polynucleobacter sp.]|nr:hypothetical protein [Polynucleobacter sp.]
MNSLKIGSVSRCFPKLLGGVLVLLSTGCATYHKLADKIDSALMLENSISSITKAAGRPTYKFEFGGDGLYIWNASNGGVAIIVEDGEILLKVPSRNRKIEIGDLESFTVRSMTVGEIKVEKIAYIASGSETIATDSLDFRSTRNQVATLLENEGYKVVQKLSDARVVVYVTQQSPTSTTKNISWSEPVLNYANAFSPQVSNSTTTVTNSIGAVIGSVGVQTRTGPSYTPQYMGQVSGSESITTYTHSLAIQAIDALALSKEKKVKELWRIHASIKSSSAKSDNDLPYMLYAAFRFVEKDSEDFVGASESGDVRAYFLNKDPRVMRLISAASQKRIPEKSLAED